MKLKFLTPVISSVILSATLLLPTLSYADDVDGNRTEPKTYVKDALITAKIKAKLAKGDSIKSLAKVSVDTVNNGDVTLTGTAESDKSISKAEMIAKHTTGVKHVDNKIELKKDD